MVTRFAIWLCLILAGSAVAADEKRSLLVEPTKLFDIESVIVVKARDSEKKVLLEMTNFEKPGALPGEGPFDLLVKPKGGLPIRVVENLRVQTGETFTLSPASRLGSVEVVGDNLPRAERIVVTELKDPGPGEKGHAPVQWGKEYRTELIVPDGTYAVWVVPANGSSAVRVADNVRIQAGRSTRVGD
jgi:hypothetical protein